MEIKHNFWKKWKNVFFLFLLYLSAHFLLLVSKVIMWDGWLWTSILKQKNYERLYQLLDQANIPHIYASFRIVDWFGNPVAISNILVFTSWLIAGVCIYFILKDFARVGEKNAFFIAALFLLSPIFIVRFEMTIASYSFSNAAFFLGAYSFLRAGTATRLLSKIVLPILAVVFFIVSFLTNSFLVFYGALILFAFFLFLKKEFPAEGKTPKLQMSALYKFVKKNIFWILLPFIFYLAQRKFIGSTYGEFEGYNCILFFCPGITFFNILFLLIDRMYQFIVYGFFGPIIFSVSVLQRKIFLAIFLIFSACIFFFEKKLNILSPSAQSDADKTEVVPKNIFIWGVLVFVFGALAYILVGKAPFPYGSGFAMRHGLMLPLGSSLIIFAFINGLLNNKIRRAAKIIILAVFISYNIYNYYNVDMDWYRQVGIVGGLRENYSQGQMGKSDLFIFYDKFPDYTWENRAIRNHEYSGYLYEATGNRELMGTGHNSDPTHMSISGKNDQFNFGDQHITERLKNIIITPSPSNRGPTVKNWVKIKIADVFGEENELRSLVKDLIGINIQITAQTPKETSWLDEWFPIQ